MTKIGRNLAAVGLASCAMGLAGVVYEWNHMREPENKKETISIEEYDSEQFNKAVMIGSALALVGGAVVSYASLSDEDSKRNYDHPSR